MSVETDLLIIGGKDDPQIIHLCKQAEKTGKEYLPVLFGRGISPRTTYEPATNIMKINGTAVHPKAVFIRPDVFARLKTNDPLDQSIANDFFFTYVGWLLANPDIKIFNRSILNRTKINKAMVLRLACEEGLRIPDTVFTNDIDAINIQVEKGDTIQKPVEGNGYCKPLNYLDPKIYKNGKVQKPLTVQNRLISPEYRLFRIGGKLQAIKVMCEDLDYRVKQNARLEYVEDFDKDLAQKYFALTDRLGMDYAAADFKTCPDTGELMFLEVNAGAMFAAFDVKCHGKISRMIFDALGI